MPSIPKYFQKSYDIQLNPLIFALFFLLLVGNFFLVSRNVEAGRVYFFMGLAIIAILFMVMLFTRGDTFQPINKFVKSPFTTSLGLASALFLLGLAVPLVIQTIARFIFPNFSITSLMIPLSGAEIFGGTAQSFATAEIQGSTFWQIINVGFNAGTMEELAFSFAIVLASILVYILIMGLVNLFRGKSYTDFTPGQIKAGIWFAIVFSTLVFVGAHTLNSTYDTIQEYLIAGAFKFISLVSIYIFGVLLIFWIGYHIMNNLIWLAQQNGAGNLLNTMLNTPVGLIILSLLILMILAVLFSRRTTEEVGAYFRS